MNSCVFALVILFLWRVEEGAEAANICHCPFMEPPLVTLCNSGVVIRAFITGSEVVDSGTMKSIKYDISAIQVFKGPDGDIDAVYSSLGCRADLQTNGAEYLITGRLESDKTVHITACNFISLWEDLSTDQLNLLQNYKNNCS